MTLLKGSWSSPPAYPYISQKHARQPLVTAGCSRGLALKAACTAILLALTLTAAWAQSTATGTVSGLLTLQPAISPNGSVAGAVRDQNTFQLDGGNNSSDMDGTMNTYTPSYASAASANAGGGPTGVMPTPVESIEEFKVNVAGQTADFNGSSGAQIQLATRRGGKSWHCALYEYYLSSNLCANNPLNNP